MASVAPIAARVLGSAAAAVGAGGVYMFNFDEGTRRSVLFWTECAPIYVHYRIVQFRVKDAPEEVAAAEFNKLHDRYAPVVEALTLKLKGGSTSVHDIVSCRAFEQLTGSCFLAQVST